mgnify:CR=1 FL=1
MIRNLKQMLDRLKNLWKWRKVILLFLQIYKNIL